jgi:drug/metabolite transporter (DMT)-like permease
VLLVNQVSFVYALKLGSATTVALILGMTPIFAAIISSLVGLEQLTGRFWVATLVGFVGVALVALGSGGDLSSDLGGDLLAIVLAISWAAYSVTIAPLMRSYSPYRISAVVLVIMCIPFVALSAPQIADQDYASLGALVWAGLAFAIVGPLFLTNILWFKSIGVVGPSRATLFANAQPFVAAIFAALILSEHLHWLQIVGGVAILLGIVLERRWRRPAAAEAAEPAGAKIAA